MQLFLRRFGHTARTLTLKSLIKNACSPYCSPYSSYGTSKEKFSKYQDILFLEITSFILIT